MLEVPEGTIEERSARAEPTVVHDGLDVSLVFGILGLDHLQCLCVDELGVFLHSNGSVQEAVLDLGPLTNGEEPVESKESNDREMVGNVPRTFSGYRPIAVRPGCLEMWLGGRR